MQRTFLGLLLVSAALAGCIGGGPGDSGDTGSGADCAESPYDLDGITFLSPDEDPLDGLTRENAFIFETTNVRTCSLPAVGWHPLRVAGEAPAEINETDLPEAFYAYGQPDPHMYLGEIDMRGDLDLGAVAVLGNGETPTIYLLDISDRRTPRVLSTIEQLGTYIVDVKISDDGALLFAASQSIPSQGELQQLPALDSPTGFTVYNIEDPAAPFEVGDFADPQIGCHMLSHQIIDGTDVLGCISQNVRFYRLERVADDQVRVLGHVDYLPATGPAGTPQPGDPPVGTPDPTGGTANSVIDEATASGPHDITIQVDPDTDQTLGFVSHWNSGLRVVDLTDPLQPTELGSWTGEGATHYDGNVHTAMMFHVDGKRYVMASPEYTYSGQVPSLWVLDATDYGDLKLVAEWYHPGEHTSQGLFLTTHQWQVAPTGPDVNASDVHVYLTMNHGGVWALSFGEILAGNNTAAVLGYNLARTPLDPDTPIANAVLATWDVNVVDGHIYGSDRSTGLWVFHLADDELGNEALTGFA